MRRRIMQGLAATALAALSLNLACVDKVGGDTGTAPLYVFDGNSNTVLVWNDINALYNLGDGKAAPEPDRKIVITKVGNTTMDLAWGGMALDTNQRLYLVSKDGNNALQILKTDSRTESSTYTSSTDYYKFSLASSETAGVANGKVGQAAVDSNGDLLATVCDSSGKSQILKVSLSEIQAAKTLAGMNLPSISGDIYCAGVATNGNNVYAYYNDGAAISTGGTDFDGPRLRSGTYLGGFTSQTSQVIINKGTSSNPDTELANFGCLAYDYSSGSGLLWVARQNATDPVLAFQPSAFTSTLNVAPYKKLQMPSSVTAGYLRIIAHAGRKDWLVGTPSSDQATTANDSTPTSTICIWKAPSKGDTSISLTLPGSPKILGLAVDGTK